MSSSSSSFSSSSSSSSSSSRSSSSDSSKDYQAKRKKAYPKPQDQLDQIFKDLKTNPNLKEGVWYTTITAIKATYEKPHESEKE
jgi:hypothetical protein